MKALTTILAENAGLFVLGLIFGLVFTGIVLDQLGWH